MKSVAHDARMRLCDSFRLWLLIGIAGLILFGQKGLSEECGWEWCACKHDLSRSLLARQLLAEGSSGKGRQYAPDREFDVTHVKLYLQPSFEHRMLAETAHLTFQPVGKPKRQIRLDAVNLDVQGGGRFSGN